MSRRQFANESGSIKISVKYRFATSKERRKQQRVGERLRQALGSERVIV